MTSEQFIAWRKRLSLSQKEAANVLGTNARTVAYYEAGKRDGEPFAIPKYIALACAAVALGLKDYDG